jgi:hypothetical protein
MSDNRLKIVFCFFLFSILAGCASAPVGSRITKPIVTPKEGQAIVVVYRLDEGEDASYNYAFNVNGFERVIYDGYYYVYEFYPGVYPVQGLTYGSGSYYLGKYPSIVINEDDVGKVFTYWIDESSNLGSTAWTRSFAEWPVNTEYFDNRKYSTTFSAYETSDLKELFGADYFGRVKDGKPAGSGRLQWSDGRAYEGAFKDGRPTAEGIFYLPNGRYYKGQYDSNAMPLSPALIYHDDGRLAYNGEVRNGIPNGMGISYSADHADIISGKFNNDRPDGVVIKNSAGEVSLETFENGRVATVSPVERAKTVVKNADETQLHLFLTTIKNEEKVLINDKLEKTAQLKEYRQARSSCHCAFNLCLTSYRDGLSYEERKRQDERTEAFHAECRRKVTWGGELDPAKNATLQAELDRIDRKYEKLMLKKQKAEADKAKLNRELDQSREARIKKLVAEQQQKIQAEIQAHKKSCMAAFESGRYPCFCGGVLPQRNNAKTCSK